jgi:sugar/nucleoside kinase (ribokinase family)
MRLQIGGVLCAGNISHDILARPVGELAWGRSNWVKEFREDMGGNGSNTAFAMARLGVPVRLLGKVGPDERGERILAKLAGAGVDISLVERSQAPTTTTVVLVNHQGDRQFIQMVGASYEVLAEPSVFSPDLCAGITHYHQSNVFALPNLRRHAGEQMRRAKDAGLTTSIDTGWAVDGQWVETLGPALTHCDLMLANEDEARAITGETDTGKILRAIHALGAATIVLKLGAKGCVVSAGGQATAVAGYCVEAVDSTGAGDCFAAGLFAALHRGFDLVRAAEFGNAVGAMVVSRLGATAGVASFGETLAWVEGRSRSALQ